MVVGIYIAIIPCVWLACAHLFPAHLSHASASNDDDDDDDATRKIPSVLYCAGFALICGWAMFFQSSPVKIFWKSRLHHHLDGRLGVFHKHCPCCSPGEGGRRSTYLGCVYEFELPYAWCMGMKMKFIPVGLETECFKNEWCWSTASMCFNFSSFSWKWDNFPKCTSLE